jgi:hypothetical protein
MPWIVWFMFSANNRQEPQLLKKIPVLFQRFHQELRHPLKTLLPRLLLHQGCQNRNSLLSLVNPSRTFQQWQMGMLTMSGHLNLRSSLQTGRPSTWEGASGNCAATSNICRFAHCGASTSGGGTRQLDAWVHCCAPPAFHRLHWP